MANAAESKLLRSWKEISAHLGVDERTCARWEQRFGMPVHRAAEGAGKSHVFAYAEELDAWFRETFPASGGSGTPATDRAAEPDAREWKRRRPARTALIAGLILVGAVAGFLVIHGGWPYRKTASVPANFHIRGTSLIIVDGKDRELWQRDIGIDGLCDEETYRKRFQVVSRDLPPGHNLPWLRIKDIDGDGRPEILFAVKRESDSLGEGILICYDSLGKERWRFRAGREMTYKGRPHSADYRIHGFRLRDTNGDGRLEIFLVSFHYPWEPCQLAVLDTQGILRGEFWNAGYLVDIAFADLDGDGREELYATGVNNEYGGGCLAIFDPADVHGASPQGKDYTFANLENGSELYYIDFPRSDVSLAEGSVVAGNTRLDVTSSRSIQVIAQLSLVYEFGPDMRCLDVSGGHGFIATHRKFLAEGKVHSTLDAVYYQKLLKSLRYWNGGTWVDSPTMNLARNP